MNLLGILGDSIAEGFYGIMLLLDGAIYSLIASSYRIFMAVASARIMSSAAYKTVANNVYIIVGVVMLFVLAYAIIKAIIDPDEMTKGKLSGTQVLKRITITILGLALTPVIFNLLYQGQSLFIEKDVLSNLFFRSNNDCVDAGTIADQNVGEVCVDDEIKKVGGALTAASVWQAFFYPVDGDADSIKIKASDLYIRSAGLAVGGAVAGAAGVAAFLGVFGSSNIWNPVGWVCLGAAAILGVAAYASAEAGNDLNDLVGSEEVSLQDAYNISSATGEFYIFYGFLDEVIEEETINYVFIISSIAGLFVLYVFICFSIDMGIRAAKLAYYQIIAPIPLILQIIPSFNDEFNKYIKNVIKTFAEVFIRIIVVYICIYMICHLTELFSTTEDLWGNQELNTVETILALAALILGIIAFAKMAPGLIGEIFGLKSGDMKLGLREKLQNGGLFAAAQIGVGGVQSGVQGFRSKWQSTKAGEGRFIKALGTGASHMIGGSARAFGDQHFGPGHKAPASFKEAWAGGSRAADKVSDAESSRAKAMAEGKKITGKDDAVVNYAAGRGKQIGQAIDRWSTGTVDTSYEDGYAKFLTQMNDFKDKARAKAEKVAAVGQAKRAFDRLSNMTIGDYDEDKYAKAVQRAASRVDNDARFSPYLTRDGDGNITGFAAGTSDAIKNAYTSERANAVSSVNKEEFRYTPQDKAKAEGDLAKARQRAKDFYEKTADAAFYGLLESGDDAAISLYSEFFTSNLGDMQKYKDEILYGDVTIGKFMSDKMKVNLNDGSFNADATNKDVANRTIKLTGTIKDTSGVTHTLSGDYALIGSKYIPISDVVVGSDGKLARSSTATGPEFDMADIIANMEGRGSTLKIDDSSAGIGIVSMGSEAKKAKSKLLTDPKYLSKVSRKRIKAEKK